MKIESVDLFEVVLPYSGGVYRLSNGREYTNFDSTIVRITTDDGIEGWGESTPFGPNYIAAHALGVRAGIAEIAPHLIGLDPRHVDRLNEVMDQSLLGHAHAKTPLDLACWDIFGKSVDMAVYDLLGGSTGIRLPLISSIPANTPDGMRENVARHRERGYLGHSIKVGALDSEGGPALDAERVQACLADRKKGEYFLVDANGGMTVENALRFLRILGEDTDVVLEAPCVSLTETLKLRSRTNVPIVLDELSTTDVSVAEAIASNAAEGIGLKISKAGGLTQGRRQRDMCIAAGMTMSVQDTVGSDIAFAGIVHLGQTIPERNLRCVLDVREMVSLSTAATGIEVEDGRVIANKQPGLGISPNLSVLGTPTASW